MSTKNVGTSAHRCECPFCGHEWMLNRGIGWLKSDLGTVYATESKDCESHLFYPQECPRCLLQFMASTSCRAILGFCNTDISFKEPDFHFDHIYSMITKCGISIDPRKIELSSTKDQALSTYLSRRIVNNNDGVSLKLCRRFIEHINCFNAIKDVCDKIPRDGYILIESIDYGMMSSTMDSSYIWDERISYASLTEVILMLERHDLEYIRSHSFSDKDHFFVALFRKVHHQPSHDSLAMCDSTRAHLKRDFALLYEKVSSVIECRSSIAFIGVNNYSLTAASIAINIKPSVRVTMYDDSSPKLYSWWNSIQVMPTKDVEKSELYVFAFRPPSSSRDLTERFSIVDSADKILSLKSLFNDND